MVGGANILSRVVSRFRFAALWGDDYEFFLKSDIDCVTIRCVFRVSYKRAFILIGERGLSACRSIGCT